MTAITPLHPHGRTATGRARDDALDRLDVGARRHPGHRRAPSAAGAGRSASRWPASATLLVADGAAGTDGWLAARERRTAARAQRPARAGSARSARRCSRARTSSRGARRAAPAASSTSRHHVQRLHDLAYDEVELELGGSE